MSVYASPEKENILRKGSLEAVKQFFSEHKSFRFYLGKNPIHFAAQNPDIDVLKFLVDELGLPFDRLSDNDITPLHAAAHCGNLEAIQLLIERGADYNRKYVLGDDIIDILKGQRKFDLVPKVKKIIVQYSVKKDWVDGSENLTDQSVLRKRNKVSGFFELAANSVVEPMQFEADTEENTFMRPPGKMKYG